MIKYDSIQRRQILWWCWCSK